MNIVKNHLNVLNTLKTAYKIESETLDKRISYLENLKDDDLTFFAEGVGALSLEDMATIRKEHNNTVETIIQVYKPHILSLLTVLTFAPSYARMDQDGLKDILNKLYPYLSTNFIYNGDESDPEYVLMDSAARNALLSLMSWLLIVSKKCEASEDPTLQTTIEYVTKVVEAANRYIWIKE
jgi:hypothetical protein